MIYGAALNLIFRTITWFSQSASTVANHQSTLTQFQIRDILSVPYFCKWTFVWKRVGWFSAPFCDQGKSSSCVPAAPPKRIYKQKPTKEKLKKTSLSEYYHLRGRCLPTPLAREEGHGLQDAQRHCKPLLWLHLPVKCGVRKKVSISEIWY